MPGSFFDTNVLSERPLFVFAMHRSGGTLLTRILNCHPQLVIWGEHAGFINKLADADLIMRSLSDALPELSDEEIEVYTAFDDDCLRLFNPWMSPFSYAEFRQRLRNLILSLYSRGLNESQRWGFKEIRYHRPSLAAFLERLFPEGQFLLLIRDPIELCVSNILVQWSLEYLLPRGAGDDPAEFVQVVDDCLYAIVAIQANLMEIARLFSPKCMLIHYEALVHSPETEIDRLSRFLDLPFGDEVLQRTRIAIGSLAGATDKTPNICNGLLNEREIRMACNRLLSGIKEEIRTAGVDTARLMGLGGKGKYSLLLGEASGT